MELNISEINFPYRKTVFESNVEQNIDTDFTLPDYYPEIVKVLKCITEINILSAQCNDSGVKIGGQVVLTLLYFGGDDQPNSFTHTVPFTKTVDASDVVDGFAHVVPRLNYLNTKAVGPRKVEAHGSMAIGVSVESVKGCKVVSAAECDGIYARADEISVAEPHNTISKSVFVEDDIQIPQTRPSVGKILRKCAKATVTECKYTSGKAVLKGDFLIELLYCPSDGGRPILLTDSNPFSQVLDCPCDSDDVSFDAVARVDSFELHPKTSVDGEVRNISFEAKVCIELVPYCLTKKHIVTDAFSGKYSADIVSSELFSESVSDRINDTFVCRKTMDFGEDNLTEIYDVWSTSSVDFVTVDNSDILVKGSVAVNILGCDHDNQTVYFERPIDYEYRFEIGAVTDEIRCNPDIAVQAVEHSLNAGGTIDVAVELSIKTTVFSLRPIKAITKINIDQSTLLSKSNDSAVILYFAENESAWDIAGKYQTDPECICKINGIDSIDEKCNKVLLIPNVQ